MEVNGYSIKFKIQPGFVGIADQLLKIDSVFPDIAHIIQNKRNDIRVLNIYGLRLVVKSFKGMYWPNRLAYSFLRKSKAQRSFEVSLRLQAMAFQVPTPVGYIDYYRWGILQSSYFISFYQEHENLQSSLARYSKSHSLSKLFAAFTFQLHQAGVNHHDFCKANILCVPERNTISFFMVDLNRVRFHFIGYQTGLKSLSRLGIEQPYLDEILKTYTRLWEKSFEEANEYIQSVRDSRKRFGKIRLFFKRLFFPSRIPASSGKSKLCPL
jgi:hypothetical protein